MFLELLRGKLAIRDGLHIAGQGRTVAEGVAACAAHSPDLLLLDLALPDGDGIEVARHFLQQNPLGRVIILTGHKSSFVCPPWLDRNLQALISKNDTFQSLRAELDELLGKSHSKGPATSGDHTTALLTPREGEVFRLLGDGLSSREIADRLQIALHTVLTHRKRIARKLGTRGAGLVRQAMAQRLAPSPRRDRPQ